MKLALLYSVGSPTHYPGWYFSFTSCNMACFITQSFRYQPYQKTHTAWRGQKSHVAPLEYRYLILDKFGQCGWLIPGPHVQSSAWLQQEVRDLSTFWIQSGDEVLVATIALHFALCCSSVPTRNSQMETACGHKLYNSLLSHQDSTAGFLKPWKSKADNWKQLSCASFIASPGREAMLCTQVRGWAE